MNNWVTLLINFSRFLIGRAELVNSWFDGTVIFGRVEHTSIKLFLATSIMARTSSGRKASFHAPTEMGPFSR